jgi:uncharacterized protein (TIGR03067 family)
MMKLWCLLGIVNSLQGASMHRCFGIPLILISPFILSAGDDAVGTELKALQGRWKAVALEAGGKRLPKEAVPDFTFVVGEGGKSIGKMPKSEYRSRMSVDPNKKPKSIDNAHETGAHKGKKQFGVYKLEGAKWTVCMTAPGAMEKDRPKSFDTKDTANVVFVFERIKEEKNP